MRNSNDKFDDFIRNTFFEYEDNLLQEDLEIVYNEIKEQINGATKQIAHEILKCHYSDVLRHLDKFVLSKGEIEFSEIINEILTEREYL